MTGWVDYSVDPWVRHIDGKYLVPVSQYKWEHGDTDCSLNSSISLYMPASELIEGMALKRSLKSFGSWCDSQGEIVFHDNIAQNGTSSFAMVSKESLLNWLNENDLELVWLIGGEKQLIRTGSKFYGRMVYNTICQYNGKELVSERWFDKQGQKQEHQ